MERQDGALALPDLNVVATQVLPHERFGSREDAVITRKLERLERGSATFGVAEVECVHRHVSAPGN